MTGPPMFLPDARGMLSSPSESWGGDYWCIGCDEIRSQADMRWTPLGELHCRKCITEGALTAQLQRDWLAREAASERSPRILPNRYPYPKGNGRPCGYTLADCQPLAWVDWGSSERVRG